MENISLGSTCPHPSFLHAILSTSRKDDRLACIPDIALALPCLFDIRWQKGWGVATRDWTIEVVG